MYFSLSWRNIWRNKKRTIIVSASVFFAVILSSIMRSAQLGSYSYMIHSSAKLFTGYLQVQGNGFWENRSLDRSIKITNSQMQQIESIPNVTNIVARLEAFALVSFGTDTKVSAVVGIDPDLEDRMTGLGSKLTEGEYLNQSSQGILIAEGLAEILSADIGDSIIVLGQGYHGQTAAANLPIIGKVKLPFESMNNAMVFLALPKAQEVFSCDERITSLPVLIDNIQHLDAVHNSVRGIVGEKYDIMMWNEMMPDLEQNIEVDNASGIIMLGILYIVIGFGVFGTVMMMVSERAKEFGILVSVGMRKSKLIMVTTIETILVTFLGALVGVLGAIPFVLYLRFNPIDLAGGEAAKLYDQLGIEPILNFSAEPIVFISQAVVVFLIALITIIYPIMYIRQMEPVEALRG
jgi:ABC-type lipoprotein release transport system permease subunit